MKRTPATTFTTTALLGLSLSLGAAGLLLGTTGCSTGGRYEQSTGEYIDDHGLSAAVKKALGKDMQYKYEDVKVSTFKGVVQLSGFTASRAQKDRAGDLAMGVDRVKEVVNNITVKE